MSCFYGALVSGLASGLLIAWIFYRKGREHGERLNFVRDLGTTMLATLALAPDGEVPALNRAIQRVANLSKEDREALFQRIRAQLDEPRPLGTRPLH